MFQYQKVSLSDFTGGITDKYIDGPANTYQTCINMDITKFGTLATRRGFKWYLEIDSNAYATDSSAAGKHAFLGLGRRTELDDSIIVSQYDDFYAINDEVEITFDTINISSSTITFPSAHGLAVDDELYIKDVTDTAVGIAKDTRYYFMAAASPSVTTGRLSLASGGSAAAITLTVSTYSKTVTLVKKATATLIATPSGSGSLLKAGTVDSNQRVSFTEQQASLIASSNGGSGVTISRPINIYYGSPALLFVTNDKESSNTFTMSGGLANVVLGDTVESTDQITVPAHGLTTGDIVEYRIHAGGGHFSADGVEYYVCRKTPDTISLHTSDAGATAGDTTDRLAIPVNTTFGVAALIPKTSAALKWRGVTLGLPKPGLKPDGTVDLAPLVIKDSDDAVAAGANAYHYKYVYKYSIVVDGVEKDIVSEPSAVVTIADDTITGSVFNSIQARSLRTPTQAAGASNPYLGSEWDLSNVTIDVYRTIAGAASIGTYYKAMEIRNDPAADVTYGVDATVDATLTTRTLFVPNAGTSVITLPSPKAKYALTTKDITYYANAIEEAGQDSTFREFPRPFRLYQAIPGQNHIIGDNFFIDLDREIIGMGQINGLPIVFTDTFIYRVEGVFESDGTGDMRARVIDENIGCLSHASIVSTPQGIYFAGRDGFYHTDGYKFNNITEDLDDSYAEITETIAVRALINGTYDPKDQKIFWAVVKKGSTTPDQIWVLHLRSHGFTKMDALQFESTSMIVREGELYRGDTLGFVYRHSSDYKHDYVRTYSDPTILDITGTLQAVHAWDKRYIDFKYMSSATNFGTPSLRKWVNEATFSFETEGNMGIKPLSINDANNISSDLKEITRENTWSWNDPDFAWGDATKAANSCSIGGKLDSSYRTQTTCEDASGTWNATDTSVSNFRWGTSDAVVKPRRFPRRELRCRRKQVGLIPIEYKKYLSNTWGTCTLTYSASADALGVYTCTLSGGWPENMDGGFIYFPTSFNELTKSYDYNSLSSTYSAFKILDKTSATTMTFRGILDGYTNENMDWHIKNHALEQRIEIKEIAIKYGLMDNVEGRFQSEDEVGG